MRWHVNLVPAAEDSWQELKDWIAARNPEAMMRTAQQLHKVLEILEAYPYSGALMEFYYSDATYQVRRLFFGRQKQFVVYYWIEENHSTVHVIFISRTARFFESLVSSLLS